MTAPPHDFDELDSHRAVVHRIAGDVEAIYDTATRALREPDDEPLYVDVPTPSYRVRGRVRHLVRK